MTKICRRMPLGYGPSPGPRQDSQGRPYSGWPQSSAEVYTVTFRAPRRQLEDLLPHGYFSISGEGATARASLKFTKLINLPWLAGRGYNHFGLYMHDVNCHGREENINGSYLSVLFENMADPIITGRDELGYAKIFATLEDTCDHSSLDLKMGWEGSQWGSLVIKNFEKVPSDPQDQVISPLLHLKYFPRTGEVGAADVEYPTVTPSRSVRLQEIYEANPDDVELKFDSLGWSSLPTLHHIVDKLAKIQILEITKVEFEIHGGGDDVSSQRSIPM